MIKTKKAINLSGKMTKLGVTKLSPLVLQHMNEAAQSFYLLSDLQKETEEVCAKKFGSKGAFLTASASAGLYVAAAAVARKVSLKEKGLRTIRIAVPTMHQIDYGAPLVKLLELAGAEIISVGSSNLLTKDDLEDSILKRPDAAVYVSSHHVPAKPTIDAKSFASHYRSLGIPVMIDIAAERDVWSFVDLGFEFVVVSGSKAISGPATGIILLDDAAWYEHLSFVGKSTGRVAKVAKENMAGLIAALSEYKREENIQEKDKKFAEKWCNNVCELGFKASVAIEQKRAIVRIKLEGEPSKIVRLNDFLKKENIYTRDYGAATGSIELDLRQTDDQEMKLLVLKLKEAQK